jgi:hypothetical protein|tara:strand:+ start:750 stop:902 length:153 start_codon:yes stop_codon:yes gene_type:complete
MTWATVALVFVILITIPFWVPGLVILIMVLGILVVTPFIIIGEWWEGRKK